MLGLQTLMVLGSEDPNSGVHVGTASALSTEPSPLCLCGPSPICYFSYMELYIAHILQLVFITCRLKSNHLASSASPKMIHSVSLITSKHSMIGPDTSKIIVPVKFLPDEVDWKISLLLHHNKHT